MAHAVAAAVPERVLILVNPIAGRGRGRIIAERIAGRLVAEGYSPTMHFQPAGQLDDGQIDRDARAAIVIGGDGTIRSVAKRFFADDPGAAGDEKPRPPPAPRPPLLIVPMGTANLLGRHLGVKWDLRTVAGRVLTALRQGKTVSLDCARANDELFLLMAGIGIDAEIVHELDRARSGPIQLASYVLPAALAFTTYAYPPLSVVVDGRPILKDQPAIAFVGNVREYGTGFPMLPHARPDDGLLDVCVLPCRHRLDALRLLFSAALGQHVQSAGALYAKGTSIQIHSSEPVAVQIDGEAAGHTPVDIRLLPVRIPFIVPAP